MGSLDVLVGGGVGIMLVLQDFLDGVGVTRLRKLVSWMGEEMLSDESLDDDELSWMVFLKQHGFTLILFLMDFDDSDEVLDLVISRFELSRLERLRYVMVMV